MKEAVIEASEHGLYVRRWVQLLPVVVYQIHGLVQRVRDSFSCTGKGEFVRCAMDNETICEGNSLT